MKYFSYFPITFFDRTGSIGFGIMYMLAEYATFSMANNIEFNKINAPEFSMLINGTIISLVGMVIGHLIYRKRNRIMHGPAIIPADPPD